MAERIDIKKLRYLVTVAQTRSVTGAADALSITQPALTRCIAEVEDELDIQVFYRLPRGVQLTEEGQKFINRARTLLADFDALTSHFREGSDKVRRKLKLGVVPAPYSPLAAPILAQFAASYPNADIVTTGGSPQELIPQLHTGEYDALLSASSYLKRWPDLHVIKIASLHFAYAVRKGHPLQNNATLSKQDLLRYPSILPSTSDWMYQDIAQLHQKLGLPMTNPTYTADDFSVIFSILNTTDAFYPVVSIEHNMIELAKDFALVRLSDIEYKDYLCLAYSKTRTVAPLVKNLIPLALEVVGDVATNTK